MTAHAGETWMVTAEHAALSLPKELSEDSFSISTEAFAPAGIWFFIVFGTVHVAAVGMAEHPGFGCYRAVRTEVVISAMSCTRSRMKSGC